MKRTIAMVLAATSLLVSGTAFAATTACPLLVTVEVFTPKSCSISTNDALDFGTYNATSNAPLYGNASVQVNCTTGTNYTLTPDYGLHSSGNVRFMANGTKSVQYELYGDSERVAQWGPNSTYVINRTSFGSMQTLNVYGKLLPFLAADGSFDGIYSDTVAMVVDYTP